MTDAVKKDLFTLHLDLIDTLFAYIANDDEGHEGLAGAMLPGTNMFVPLIGADLKRVISLRELAQISANQSGMTIRLYHFTERQLIDTIEPQKKP